MALRELTFMDLALMATRRSLPGHRSPCGGCRSRERDLAQGGDALPLSAPGSSLDSVPGVASHTVGSASTSRRLRGGRRSGVSILGRPVPLSQPGSPALALMPWPLMG